MINNLTVIGGGLSGSEAAWQIAQRGIKVNLFEMRPLKMTPAHKTGLLAELVCSNSLRGASSDTAPGLLKEELRLLKSLIISCADEARVDAGNALTVDRREFSNNVEKAILNHPYINLIREEVTEIPEGIVVVATGPLTSDELADKIKTLCGEDSLYFYDAVSPIIEGDSINYMKTFKSSRYNKGEGHYLNCPMSESEYNSFYEELIKSEKVPLHSFEEEQFFEGCLPVEEIARRGIESLRFGPLKPVGLVNPDEPDKKFFAVVQLRPENREGTMYNMVGFQTRLKWEEQKRVFRLIPGLEEAKFCRYGVVHRNTFMNSPKLLRANWILKNDSRLLFAGQITGIEGYIESVASGLMAGINAARLYLNEEPVVFPRDTALGSLAYYVSNEEQNDFQPMKINFGLFTPLKSGKIKKHMKRKLMSERALKTLLDFKEKSLYNN